MSIHTVKIGTCDYKRCGVLSLLGDGHPTTIYGDPDKDLCETLLKPAGWIIVNDGPVQGIFCRKSCYSSAVADWSNQPEAG